MMQLFDFGRKGGKEVGWGQHAKLPFASVPWSDSDETHGLTESFEGGLG